MAKTKPKNALEEIRAALARTADARRAVEAKRYLKSDLVFMGTALPDIRKVAKEFARAHPGDDVPALRALVTELWDSDVHELRSVAIALLEIHRKKLGTGDAPFVLDLVRTSKTWAYVDWLATKVLGSIFERDPGLSKAIDRWAKDDDFWVRRTALLVFHDPFARGGGDFDHFARLAVPMLGEREFFIRKAIGWVLRTTVKRTPERTVAFVERHAAAMSGLSFKEATRNLPAATQKRLVALRNAVTK